MPPRCRSRWPASSCTAFLTGWRPAARHPAGTQASGPDRIHAPAASRGCPPGASCMPGHRRGHGTSPPLTGSACRRLPKARCPARVPGSLPESGSSTNTDSRFLGFQSPSPAGIRLRRPGTRAPGPACDGRPVPRDIGGAASGQSRRHGLAPGPSGGLGLSHLGGGGALGEGPDFLGDGAPVGGGGQLAEYREQAEVDALAGGGRPPPVLRQNRPPLQDGEASGSTRRRAAITTAPEHGTAPQ